MQKPSGYDEAKTMGDYTPINLGGHYCTIKQVAERNSKNGLPMIVICLDFIAPDEQAGYFTAEFRDDTRPEKKWPHNATIYILTQDYQDKTKTSRAFKTFCTTAENSNSGFKIQWGDNWGAQFKGKRIGAVYGEVENEYNGKVTKRHEHRWFCSWDKVKEQKIPDPKLLPNKPAPASGNGSVPDDFMAIPDGGGDEVPF